MLAGALTVKDDVMKTCLRETELYDEDRYIADRMRSPLESALRDAWDVFLFDTFGTRGYYHAHSRCSLVIYGFMPLEGRHGKSNPSIADLLYRRPAGVRDNDDRR